MKLPMPIYRGGSNRLRLVLYPAGLLAAAILWWVGWGTQPEASIEQRLASAELLARSGALAAAGAEVEAVLATEPENLHALLIQGMVAERRLHEARAIGSYERARALTDEPGLRRDIDLSLIDLERRMKRFDRARERLRAFAAEHGRAVAAERLAGLVDWESGDRQAALERFRSARAEAPEDVELALLLAGALIEEGRGEEARQLLETLPGGERRVQGSWKELARLFLESGDDESAFAALSRYAELDAQASARLGRDEYWSSLREHRLLGRLIGG